MSDMKRQLRRLGTAVLVRAFGPRVLDYLEDSRERRDELAFRADQQHQWARRGDSRGVYGPEGAELMRSLSPSSAIEPPQTPAQDTGFAAVAYTPEALATLRADKPPGWRWALFASVLVQRHAALQPRLRDHQLGYAPPTGATARTGQEVARFVNDRLNDIGLLLTQVQEFMLNPAFMTMFGTPEDESAADADGIVHIANRLMDYHERFLGLAERCRGLTTPSQYSDLLGDCARLLDGPLTGYRNFIDDFVELVAEMPDLLRGAPPGAVDGGTIRLHAESNDQLLKKVRRQVRAIAKN